MPDESFSYSAYIKEKLDTIEKSVREGFDGLRQSHSALEQRLNVSDGRITALETRISVHEGQVGHAVGVGQLRDAEKRIDTLESGQQTVTGVLESQADQRQTRRWLIATVVSVIVAGVTICGLLITLLTAFSSHVSLH